MRRWLRKRRVVLTLLLAGILANCIQATTAPWWWLRALSLFVVVVFAHTITLFLVMWREHDRYEVGASIMKSIMDRIIKDDRDEPPAGDDEDHETLH